MRGTRSTDGLIVDPSFSPVLDDVIAKFVDGVAVGEEREHERVPDGEESFVDRGSERDVGGGVTKRCVACLDVARHGVADFNGRAGD